MAVIVALSALSVVIAIVALIMARRDFKERGRFRTRTAEVIYGAWSVHATAFAAAVWLAPYRVDAFPLLALIVGMSIGGLGLAVFVLGLERFQSFGQVSGTEVGGLVTGGIYRFTRNPQYTGWIVFLLGVAIAGRSPAALTLDFAAAVAVRLWIPNEEKHLLREFGNDYRGYADRVPRFVGLTRAKARRTIAPKQRDCRVSERAERRQR